MPHAVTADGVQIAYDDRGRGDLTFLCIPGWCNRRVFTEPLADRLARRHRVLNVDLRGHGESSASVRDFDTATVAGDLQAVLAAAGAGPVVPIALVNAGWIAIELARAPRTRVVGFAFVGWPMGAPPAPIRAVLAALQDAQRWQQARDRLFALWFAGASDTVADFGRREMESFGWGMWARAGREIEAALARSGSPLAALSALDPPRPVLALPGRNTPDAGAAHPWLRVATPIAAAFPTWEQPDAVASTIEAFTADALGGARR